MYSSSSGTLFLVTWKLIHFHDYRTTKKIKSKTLWRAAVSEYSRNKSVYVLYILLSTELDGRKSPK